MHGGFQRHETTISGSWFADVGWKALLLVQEGRIESATPVRVLYGKRIFLSDKTMIAQRQPLTPIPRRILTRLEQTNFKWWCPLSRFKLVLGVFWWCAVPMLAVARGMGLWDSRARI